jgi:nascent polypeptide-associated complex subunit beta
MRSMLLTLVLLPLLTAAHFLLEYPPARGFDEDKLPTFPCAGYPVSPNRSDWPISGGKISLTMGHDQALVQVLLGIGNDVGDAFNYVLLPTVEEQGLGSFCITGARLPKGLNVTDGTNATIQVVTNGDPNGGLYNVCLPHQYLP